MINQPKEILKLLKQGGYPQRINRAGGWIDKEIVRLKTDMARKAAYRNHPEFYHSKKIIPLKIIKDLLKDLLTALEKHPIPENLNAQIACVKREIALRKAVYSKRVKAGKMKKEKARAEYDTMRDVLQALEKIKLWDHSLELKNGPKAGAF